ncbi:MAG: DUF3256 family protein [Bacteroidaceae bacterium]|nr:DUF3256 family protein [Bacteroidaceae bacterium]
MRKLLFIIILLCGAVSQMRSQEMSTIFLEAPDSVLPLLSKSYRADMVDYVDAGMTARVTNSLDGSSTLEELAADYMRLAVTASSTMQLKLLPLQGDTVICMVKSVNAEAADSRIYFYDKEWNLLDGRALFVYPSINDFFASATDAAIWSDACDIYLVSLTLSAGDNTLVAEYTMPEYMNVDDAAKVKPLLRKLVYRWSGARFVID